MDEGAANLIKDLPGNVRLLPQITGRTENGYLREDLGRKLGPWHTNKRHGTAVPKQISNRLTSRKEHCEFSGRST